MKPAAPARLLLDGAVGKLETVINDPGESRRGIALIAHPHPLFGGSLDHKVAQTLATTFAELGDVAIRPNFRGAGASEGSHDEGRGEADDLLRVIEWAKGRYGDLPLTLAGFSFGGFVQLLVVARVTCERLVLIAPAVGRLALDREASAGQANDQLQFRVDAQQALPERTLVVHGDEDDVVPLANVIAWAKPRQQPIVLLPGAGHFFHGRLGQLKAIVQQFCRS